ncbi:MAG: flagellar basal body-associated FliL family protein [Bdellovibrionales bacterium]|nr:flagellar basal body-associated FliL family protein [Bdellovibrionales bacterium]
MSNAQPPSSSDGQTKGAEVPLEDIDRLLEQADPEFTKSLDEVRAVEVDKSIEIEATITDDELEGGEQASPTESRWRRMRTRVRLSIFAFRQRLKNGIINFAKSALVWLKVKPKEYALYSIATAKVLAKKSAVPLVAFRNAERSQKILVLLLFAMAGVSLWILAANFKGIWLPKLTEPILRNLGQNAEWVESYDPKQEGESFYTAFPQERHEFLFQRMKVNLRRTAENPLPMGAFEIIVLLDSKDTAIEVRDREVEFFDLLQRVFEEETFVDLETELGKQKLKSRLKRELNQKLTQGWVKDVNYKTFILKP